MKFKLLKNMTSIMGFAIPIISELCIYIDWAIYAVASFALQTFYRIASLSAELFASASNVTTLNSILSRVMVLAGVFALFRLGIMLVNYILNPSDVTKLGKTGTDFIKGMIIAVILLASSKFIFEQLGRFQYLVINENKIIPKLIYGVDEPITYADKDEADRFTNTIWTLFFTPNARTSTGSEIAWENVRSGSVPITTLIGRNYNEFDYYPFISGIVGMMLIYYFAIFSVELGARVIKLVVLQVLSPVPIIMSIDPSQKNKLTNFWKAYFAIYLQIFIRILTLYLAFVVLDLLRELLGSDSLMASTRLMASGNFIIDVVLVFAVFQAAKELPKVIEDALGLKLGIQTTGKGGFGALVGGIVGGTAGLVGGAVGGALGASGAGAATTIGSGLIGAASGMVRGGISGSRGKDIVAKVQGVTGAVRKSNMLGGAFKATGGVLPFAKGGVQNFFGAQRKDQATLKEYDDAVKALNARKDELNVDVGDIQSKVSDQQSMLQVVSRGDQLRENLENAMEQSFLTSGDGRYASLEIYKSRDADLQQMKAEYQDMFGAGGQLQSDTVARQDALDRISDKEKDLTEQYEKRRLQHYEGLLPSTSVTGEVNGPSIHDDSVVRALNAYNGYAREYGLGEVNSYKSNRGPGDKNRGVSGSGAYPTRFEDLAKESAQRKAFLENQVDTYNQQVKEKQAEIRRTEDARIAKEEEKKQFKNSKDVKARDPEVRKTPPVGRAWRGRGPRDFGPPPPPPGDRQ